MTRQDDANSLRSLLEAGGYSQLGAARELGISGRMMRYYCAGAQPVPRVVMLALTHLVNCRLPRFEGLPALSPDDLKPIAR